MFLRGHMFLVEKFEEKLCTKCGFAENMCPLSGRETLTDWSNRESELLTSDTILSQLNRNEFHNWR
jgi:hypothetical protein